MDSLPSGVLALVGRFLNDSSRNACVQAAAWLRPVHESVTAHTVRFHINSPDKFRACGRLLRYILALKPRTETLAVEFNGFQNVSARRVELLDDARATFQASSVNVQLHFTDCSSSFMRHMVWSRDCLVTLDQPSQLEIRGALLAVDAIDTVHLDSITTFHALQPDVLRRIRAIFIRTSSEHLDLRNVDPATTAVTLTDRNCLSCTVFEAQNLTSVVCAFFASSGTNAHRLHDSLVTARRHHPLALKDIRIIGITPTSMPSWSTLVHALPPTVAVALWVDHPIALPFLEAMSPERTVVLIASNVMSYASARLVQLLTQKTYAIKCIPEFTPPPHPHARGGRRRMPAHRKTRALVLPQVRASHLIFITKKR